METRPQFDFVLSVFSSCPAEKYL